MISQKNLGKKIKELRKERELSQSNLAKKIGLSRAAVSEIERGNRNINALELNKIAKVFNLDIGYLLIEEGPVNVNKNFVKKNFKFSSDKLKNTILYILEKCGGKPNVGETVLYKLLYFIDFDNYELRGKPITGMNYVKLQYGPVPRACEYNKVVEKMKENKELEILNQNYHNMPQKRYVALIDADTSVFSGDEINIMDGVVDRLSDMNASTIEGYVHNDAPWQIADDKSIIDYQLVFERIAPYAHRNYDELWQDAAGEDTLKEIG